MTHDRLRIFHEIIDHLQAAMGLTGGDLTGAVLQSLADIDAMGADQVEILKSVVARILVRLAPLPNAAAREVLLMEVLEARDAQELKAAATRWHHERSTKPLDRRVVKALELVETNASDRSSVSLQALARRIDVSPTYLSRLIRRETGSGLVDHIRRRRILNAVDLLRRSREPLRLVARKVGYRHEADLCRDFKRVLGCSPRKYLREPPPADMRISATAM